jgi:hypothetical protein
MGSNVKTIGEYKVKEIFKDDGKDIKKILQDAFKAYCVSILQNK